MTIQRENQQSNDTKKGGWINEKRKQQTPYNRSSAPSPIFPFVNSATIPTTEELLIDLYQDTPASKKYGIFTNLRITNTSAENVILYVNQNRDKGVFIANNSSVSLNQGDMGGGYTSFIVYNAGTGTIAINGLRMECYKEGATIDSTMKDANKLIHDAMRMIRGF